MERRDKDRLLSRIKVLGKKFFLLWIVFGLWIGFVLGKIVYVFFDVREMFLLWVNL